MKIFYLLLLFFFTETIFSQKNIILGTITGFKDGSEIWLGDSELGEITQKTEIKNTNFSFENPSTFSPKRLYLIVKEDTTSYYLDFYIDNKSVILTGDKKGFPNSNKINGSKSQTEKIVFEKGYKSLQDKWDSINNLIGIKKDDSLKYEKGEIDIDRVNRTKIYNQIDSIKIASINFNPNRYIAVIELFYLKEKFEKDQVRKLYIKLDEQLKNTDYGKSLKIYLDINKSLEEGDFFLDFEAKDITDVSHKLSEYKGKYILLDFIQTYCFACVASNEELKKLNSKHKKKLQIVTFCSDKSENIWREGYKEHNIEWVSLWNGEGLNGRVPQIYGTDGTPTFILINPEGKIIKKIFGYEDGLLEKLLKKITQKK